MKRASKVQGRNRKEELGYDRNGYHIKNNKRNRDIDENSVQSMKDRQGSGNHRDWFKDEQTPCPCFLQTFWKEA